jgi:chemosensory pili system protein ChpA (sensor histidine kinase/response regulator)
MDGTSDSREDARMRPGDGADRAEVDPMDQPGLAEATDAGSDGVVGLESLRGVFLVEADEILSAIGERLSRLRSEPRDPDTLAEIAARGHALKGSAAMADMPALSRAGQLLQRAAELASELADQDRESALDLIRASEHALAQARRMLAPAVDAHDCARILQQLGEAFDPATRLQLETDPEDEPEDDEVAAALDDEDGLDAAAATDDRHEELDDESASEDDLDAVTAEASFDPELASSLAEIFRGELTELLADVPDLIAGLVDPGDQTNLCADLGRIFHTVKGSAATVGLEEIRQLGWELQDAFEEQAERATPIEPDFVDRIEGSMAALFLAAGLEPPATAIDLVRDATQASVLDGEGDLGPDAASAGGDDEDAAVPIEPEMMEAFALDAETALEACETALLQLEQSPREIAPLRVLFRQFHTLKGAAAAVGLTRIAAQLHAGESLLEAVLERGLGADPERLVDLLLELVDSVAGLLAEARGSSHGHRILADVDARVNEALAAAPRPAPASVAETRAAPSSPAPTTASTAAPEPAPSAPADADSAIVRVHASRLDLLMGRVSELVVSRTRMEDSIGVVQELRDKLHLGKLRMNEAIEGLRGFEFQSATASAPAPERQPSSRLIDDFTDLEFDKYDDFNVLTRTLVELSADSVEIVEQISAIVDMLAEESRQVSKITSSLQRTVTGMRLLSVEGLFRRLGRPVREAARQTEKQVELRTTGGDVQLDRGVIESLYGPLLHLVRNSVSHGIEPPEARRAAGKPPTGRIEVAAVQGHGNVEVVVRDDGRGLDFAAIRAKGEKLGLIPPGVPATREQLAELIFRPGFSTQATVTDLAGRGVGMDVVVDEIEKLRGNISVSSIDGRGTVFHIHLPLATVIDQVLLLRSGTQTFALSQGPVDTILKVEADRVIPEGGGLVIELGGARIPVLPLEMLVGRPAGRTAGTAVMLRSGAERIALLVDRVEAQREAVIRPLGRVFAGHPFITSATFAGDGQVIFVLDTGRLAGAREALVGVGAAVAAVAEPKQPSPVTPAADVASVLWADDSISVRKLAEHFLTAEGWVAETAVDGRDALDKLRRGHFQAVVTDLEMPRMHGYELLHEIRHDPALCKLPVIVCSSRSGEKHRRRAREAGANGYLTKPFSQEALAQALRDCFSSPEA